MRHYEIVLLVHPDQSEQVPAMLERYKEMVKSDKGKIHRSEDWGRRRLAFTINEVHKAHYAMLNVECELATLRELEKNFKFNDSIIRNLVIRMDAAVTEQSALAKARAEEEREEARAAEQLAEEKRVARAKRAAGDAAKAKARAGGGADAVAGGDGNADAEVVADAIDNPIADPEPEVVTAADVDGAADAITDGNGNPDPDPDAADGNADTGNAGNPNPKPEQA